MKYRKLRIAWSVACGLLCLLIIILWVRSFWKFDGYILQTRTARGGASSLRGSILLQWDDFSKPPLRTLGLWSYPADTASLGKNIREPYYWFYFMNAPIGITLTVPMWCPLAISIASVTAPWLRWRFSLRTLLIVMTGTAIGLGLLVYAFGK